MTRLEAGQISAVSRLFSPSVIREMGRKGKSPLFARLAHESSLSSKVKPSDFVYNFFDEAFSLLKKKAHRHEYVYKSALTQNILLGKHSLQTASMLTEFRVGNCKADLVILNGTATVYEVKSERDSLSRLERQISAYRQVFAKVYVIAGENHIRSIFETVPSDVGILKLSSRHQITSLREAVDQPERTNSASIFDSIRLSEARQILALNGLKTPQVPNTELYSALRDIFLKLPPRLAHVGMVQVLKKTRNLKPLTEIVEQVPSSLQSAVLTVPFRKSDRVNLLQAINTRLSEAMCWK